MMLGNLTLLVRVYRLALFTAFSALTILVGRQERRLASKSTALVISGVFLWETLGTTG